MKKSVKILALLPLVAAMSCGKAEYKLTTTFADEAQDGSTVYLINYDNGDTIDSAVVADKQAVFAGTVDHAIVARVLANQSRATFILEPGVLELNWETKEVKGGALNDSVAALNAEQSALQEKAVAMSKQAKEEQWAEDKLEEELSVPLFVSKGRNIVMTEYGKYLNKRLEPIMDSLDKIPDELATMANLSTETIHMNVLAASSIVIESIINYKQQEKELNFQILQNPQNELFDITITTKLFYQQELSKYDNYVCAEKIYLAVPNNEKYKNINSV